MSAKGAGARRETVSRAGIRRAFEESVGTLIAVYAGDAALIDRMASLVAATVARGRTVFFCGNGGSAAQAQHFAAELAVRYVVDRPAIPSIALNADTAILTAVGNDYGFERVFARQIESLGRRGDLLVAMSTSGSSPNVIAAVKAAKERGLKVIGFTGARGRAFARRCDLALVVPATATARIQEAHLLVGHLLCERAEAVAKGRARPRRAPGKRGRL